MTPDPKEKNKDFNKGLSREVDHTEDDGEVEETGTEGEKDQDSKQKKSRDASHSDNKGGKEGHQ
jgi:hypothetical protein